MSYLVPAIATGLGIGGTALSGGDDLDNIIKEYKRLSKTGTGIGTLAAPGLGAVSTAYSDAMRDAITRAAKSGLSGTSLANVQGADLFERRNVATGDVIDRATAENEASKARAREALLGLLGMRSSQQNAMQQAFGSLTGAGTYGMLRGFMNEGNTTPPSFDNYYSFSDYDNPFKKPLALGPGGFGNG